MEPDSCGSWVMHGQLGVTGCDIPTEVISCDGCWSPNSQAHWWSQCGPSSSQNILFLQPLRFCHASLSWTVASGSQGKTAGLLPSCQALPLLHFDLPLDPVRVTRRRNGGPLLSPLPCHPYLLGPRWGKTGASQRESRRPGRRKNQKVNKI